MDTSHGWARRHPWTRPCNARSVNVVQYWRSTPESDCAFTPRPTPRERYGLRTSMLRASGVVPKRFRAGVGGDPTARAGKVATLTLRWWSSGAKAPERFIRRPLS